MSYYDYRSNDTIYVVLHFAPMSFPQVALVFNVNYFFDTKSADRFELNLYIIKVKLAAAVV